MNQPNAKLLAKIVNGTNNNANKNENTTILALNDKIIALQQTIDDLYQKLSALRAENNELKSMPGNKSNDECLKLKLLLDEEREKKNEEKKKYEKHIQLLRAEIIEKVSSARTAVVREVDDILKKYDRLAKDAITAARRAKDKAEDYEQELKKISQESCRNFEMQCKEKVKQILDGYRYLADKATEQADCETKALKARCTELEKQLELEKEYSEQNAVELAEEKVMEIKNAYLNLARDHRTLQLDYQNNLTKLKMEISGEIKKLENQIVSNCLNILWTNGIHISETEFKSKLAHSLNYSNSVSSN